jgi:hypothetical protein
MMMADATIMATTFGLVAGDISGVGPVRETAADPSAEPAGMERPTSGFDGGLDGAIPIMRRGRDRGSPPRITTKDRRRQVGGTARKLRRGLPSIMPASERFRPPIQQNNAGRFANRSEFEV